MLSLLILTGLVVIGIRFKANNETGSAADAPLGPAPAGRREVRDDGAGVAVQMPDSWNVEFRPPTGQGRDPNEVLLVTNRAMPGHEWFCGDHGFTDGPLSGMRATDVVLRVIERTSPAGVVEPADTGSSWPSRSGANGGGYHCDNAPAKQWRFDRVVDNGRVFHLFVIEGDESTAEDRDALWAALDRTRFVPGTELFQSSRGT